MIKPATHKFELLHSLPNIWANLREQVLNSLCFCIELKSLQQQPSNIFVRALVWTKTDI